MSDEEVPTTSGVIVNVTITVLGSTLAADAATSDTSVFVDDASEFDEIDGGTLSIAGAQYTYTVVDMTTGELALGTGLAADAADGDRVDLWDVGAGAAAVDGEAQVALPGALGNADTIRARILQSLIRDLVEGIRAPDQGESVTMQLQRSEWIITDVRDGRPQSQPGHVNTAALPRVAATTGPPDLTLLSSRGYQYASSWGPGVWGFDENAGGSTIQVPGDDGGIYIYEAGIYAVNLFINANMETADPTCVIHFFVDVSDPFASGFGVTARGGDPAPRSYLPSTSRTYYDPGLGTDGGLFPGLSWVNMDAVNISGITLEIQVQRIA